MFFDAKQLVPTAKSHLDLWGGKPCGEPFYTPSSLLWPVERAGQRFMLKAVNPEDDEADSADMLAYYNGCGAVMLIEHDMNIQLLEMIDGGSGATLEEMVLTGQDDEVTRILCDTISQLHAVTAIRPPPSNLIPFLKRSDDMRRHIKEGRVKAKDLPLFHAASGLCDELIRQTLDTQTPLHGDIHHFNMLRSETRGWLAIDPKGIWGPRIYEYANMLCNPYKHESLVANSTRMMRQASVISETANLDKNLLLHFTFLHAVQCAAWSLLDPDQDYWLACAQTSGTLAKIGFFV